MFFGNFVVYSFIGSEYVRRGPGPSPVLSGKVSLVSRNGEGLFIKLASSWGLGEAPERGDRLKQVTGKEGCIVRGTPPVLGGVGRTAPEEVMFSLRREDWFVVNQLKEGWQVCASVCPVPVGTLGWGKSRAQCVQRPHDGGHGEEAGEGLCGRLRPEGERGHGVPASSFTR